LRGNPKRFVGLNYCYPRFISTSFDRGTAESYLRTRAKSVGTRTLLELRLKRGAHALYMDVATGLIAAEYLLGPRLTFNVINAEFTTIDHVDGEVLYLVLESLDKPVLAETFDGPR
jgi:hypothetical protein